MNGLDSPLEAFTFIPLNLGTVLSTVANNLWAWLAVITATLSLWRLRTTTKTTSNILSLPPPPPTPAAPTKPTSTWIKSTPTSCKNNIDDEYYVEKQEELLTRGNSKKVFSVYFEKEEDNNHVDDEDEMIIEDGDDEVEENQSESTKKSWIYENLSLSLQNKDGLKVEMSGRDFGWYSYQNMKVIDGSVVRLWEEKRESWLCGGSPRSCRAPMVLA